MVDIFSTFSAFDFFVTYRQQLRKDLYPETGGLLGSHGEPWYEGRVTHDTHDSRTILVIPNNGALALCLFFVVSIYLH